MSAYIKMEDEKNQDNESTYEDEIDEKIRKEIERKEIERKKEYDYVKNDKDLNNKSTLDQLQKFYDENELKNKYTKDISFIPDINKIIYDFICENINNINEIPYIYGIFVESDYTRETYSLWE